MHTFRCNITSFVHFSVEFAARLLVPTRRPVLFLARIAAIPGGLAFWANFEVLQLSQNLAPVVAAIPSPLQCFSAEQLQLGYYIMSPLPQPVHHAGQDIRGDVVTLHDSSRRGDPGGLHHMPNLAGIGAIHVHVGGEVLARSGVAKFRGLAKPLYRLPLAARDAMP